MNMIVNLFKRKDENIAIRIEPHYALLSFLIPALSMALMYVAMLIYPFGDGTVLVLDLNGQYVYYFEALRDALIGEGSLFYSFERALSGEFLGIFAYYLASPLSFIVALFPKTMIQEAIFTIMVLKCGLSGLTAHYYITRTRDVSRFTALMFSSAYALCSYGIIYASNTMWIDCLYLLPLIMLGIERLIRERRYMLYTISLTIALITSYYIGFMICIFSLIYFFAYYLSCGDDEINASGESMHFIKSGLRFGLFSLVSAALASPVLLPAVHSLSFGKSEFSSPKLDFLEKTDFFDIFTKMLPGSYDTVRPEGAPVIYCSLLCLILAVIYFIAPGIKKRKKIMYGSLLAIFVMSFASTTLDLIWHGFQFPNWLNFRYSFIFSFIIVIIAVDAFMNIKRVDGKIITVTVIATMVLTAILQKFGYEKINMLALTWITLGSCVLYVIGLSLYRSGKSGAAVLLLCVTIVELYANGAVSEYMMHKDVGFSKHSLYNNFMAKYRPIADYMSENDPGLYRSENYNIKKVNDNYAIGLKGISGSTSTLNKNVIDFLADLGYSSRSHHSNYYGGTPVSDSLLGIKYLLTSTERGGDPLYNTVTTDEKNGTVLLENPYVLSLAYAVSPDFENFDTSAASNPFELMNRMCTEMIGSEPLQLFKKNKYETKLENVTRTNVSNMCKYVKSGSSNNRINFVITAENDGVMYAYFPVTNGYRRDVTVKNGKQEVKKYFTSNYHNILCLGEHKRGENVYISMTLTADNLYYNVSEYFYTVDTEVLDRTINLLERTNAQIDNDFTDSHFTGKVTAEHGRNLFMLTMPYDKNIHVYVDGERAETREVAGIFTGVMMSPGEHIFEVQYVPVEFYTGLAICAGGVLVIVVYAVVDNIIKKRKQFEVALVEEPCDEASEEDDSEHSDNT